MATPQASSRLELLQARFQQKQLQEKEQKLLQLYDQQQQRAYQVVQRGSAGSNSSNHGSSISQHTVTKTTTTSHTTSTSQGGKVRQMFDERRQTTVKGIDRSYPLEPLENKPRKQTNGNVAQKNGNLTVNRQSVTVKRVARADVNSNLNGGKPIVSYHEEITRESYGPSGRQPSDDDEFGNENHINGNRTHIEEVLDENTIERNRMMAKLHLMEYDETLKHRVKNDLESEEFPEDYMVDVPDKLPKPSVTKKLSQAEARLERFKNANAKRSSSLTKNPGTVLKKRSDPIFPAKSTSSEDESKTRIHRGSRNVEESVKSVSRGNMEDVSFSLDSEKNFRRGNENPRFFYEHTGKLRDSKGDEKLIGRTRRSESPRFFCKESEKSATTYAVDSKTREKLSPDFRSESPQSFNYKSTRKSTDQLLSKDRIKRSESPKFFCKESEKSATTYAIDSKTREKLSPEFVRNVKRRSESPQSFNYKSTRNSTDQLLSKDRIKRSESPKFFCKESEKSATTYAIDSKTREKLSPEFTKNTRQPSESPNTTRNLSPQFPKNVQKQRESPKFFCKESERSATTYAIDSKTRKRLSPEFTKNMRRRSESPKFYDLKDKRNSTDRLLSEDRLKRSESPKYFCKESEKSATTYAIDSRSRSTSPEFVKIKPRSEENIPIKSNFSIDTVDRKIKPDKSKDIDEAFSSKTYQKIKSEMDSKSTTKRMPNVFQRLTRRSSSPKCLQTNLKSTKFSKSPDFTSKISQKPSESPESRSPNLTKKHSGRSSSSPQFFTSDSEKSATVMLVIPETIVKRKSDKTKQVSKSHQLDTSIVEPRRRMSEEIIDESSKHSIRSSVSRFFSDRCEKVSGNSEDGTRDIVQSAKGGWSRDSSPLSLKDMGTSRKGAEFSGEAISATSIDSVRDWSPKSGRNSRSLTPQFPENKNRPKSTENTLPKRSKSISQKNIKKTKSKSPEIDGGTVNVLRSTRLIRDAIKRQNNNRNEKNEGSRRNSMNAEGISNAADLKKKVEACGKVERTRRSTPLAAAESSPKSSTSVEVDAEIQEITMPDQYMEHQRGKVNSKSRDKTRRSSIEELFTYSVRKPGRKRGSLFESSVFELSKRDQEKTDRPGTFGKYTGRNEKNNPSPTSDFIFPGSKCQIKEDGKKVVNREIEAEIFRSGEEKILGKYSTRKRDNFECTKKSLSSSPSPTSSLTFRDPKRQTEENRKLNRRTSRKEKILDECNKGKHGNLKCIQRSISNSPSPTSNSTTCSSRSVTSKIITRENNKVKNLNSGERKKVVNESKIRNKSSDLIIPASKRKTIGTENLSNRINGRVLHRKTPSPIQLKEKKSSSKSPRMTKESEILRSMELVRKVIKGESFDKGVINKAINSNERKSDSTRKSSSTIVYINDESSRKNYERTDSVESALRRFDSIGTESVQSSTEKRQTLEEAKAISLKALNQIDANLPQSFNRKPSLREISVVSRETEKNDSKTECQRKFARARDSIEMARITIGSKTAACKRKLFQDDSGDETETGSSRSRCSLEKLDLRNEKILGKNNKLRDEEVSLSVKQLRSIEDIRKSIDSCFERKETSSRSAIANDTLKLKRLPRRSENLAGKNDTLGDAERSSIKCAIRFSRVTKSPSPDSTKTTETSSRARRNVLSSPSKSPDTVARRPSVEMKGQEARSTKRPTLMKGTEPIGNRKTTTTTSRRKSTDVVDGAILENGVHLRDQTAETKYDNDSAATKKSDAFVIDFEEQPPKENDAPLPRKSLLRKQSTDKQIPSTQTGRSPSAMSTTCTGTSVQQGQVSGSKGKTASKAKTPTSGVTRKASASSKCGGNDVVADSLVACKICGRRFAQDRVTLHEQICTKTAQKKRKQFDAMMYRVKGTDLEKFVRSGHCKKQPEKLKRPPPKSNWRRKHEDFINAIRSAKQVQAHLAAGGKLSDLPPPPASDTSDYVQCPHCGRKFNQSAAERHIPKCENMLHNKPVHSRAPKPRR